MDEGCKWVEILEEEIQTARNDAFNIQVCKS